MRIHYFFVYQVGKLRFGMHIVHINWNPMICIFVGQLPKGPRSGPCLGLKAPTCKNFFYLSRQRVEILYAYCSYKNEYNDIHMCGGYSSEGRQAALECGRRRCRLGQSRSLVAAREKGRALRRGRNGVGIQTMMLNFKLF